VSKIGTYAFQNTAIVNFTIPAKCETIGANAFYNTKKLKKVEVSKAGNAVMFELGKQVFANSYVKELDLSNATALVSINDQAFIYDLSVVNNQLTTVTLPKAVAPATSSNFANLGATGVCFAHCTGLKEIKNLDISVVTDINPGAFENDGSLLQLDFPYCASINLDGVMSPFKGCAKLAKITFVDGWNGTIGNGADNVYYTASLTPAEQLTELGYLKEIEFKGAVYGTIDDNAFGSIVPDNACTGLTTLTFKGALKEDATIGDEAFMNCTALAKVTFSGIDATDNTAATGNVEIGYSAFEGTAITEINLGGIKVGDDTYGKTFTIGNKAFAASKLAKAQLGNIFVDGTNASGVDLTASPIFVSDLLTEFTLGTIEVTNANGTVEFGDKINPVVAAETTADYPTGVLTKVNVGQITTNGKVQFYKNSFKSEVLEEVKFAGITSEAEIAGIGYVNIGVSAFGCAISTPKSLATKAKNVEIGNIVDADPTTLPSQVEVDIKKGAFYGDKLTSVNIGELGAKTITIAEDAFSGNQLTTVEIGDITGATVTINNYAFENENAEEAMDETVTIHELASPALTIAAGAFVGPQEEGSSFTVTMGDIKEDIFSIATGAFQASPVGTASYTLGDIDADVANIAAKAFQGSIDENGDNNTTVTLGAYNNKFAAGSIIFTYPKDLFVDSWNVATNIYNFHNVVNMTVNKDVTKVLNGAADPELETLTIGGSVKGADFIKNFGESVRTVAFTGTNPTEAGEEEATVAAGAIAESAFELAALDAFANDEKVVVIYRQKTAKKSENIFNVYAFTNSGAPVEDIAAVLYTDDWSKANTFENVDIVMDFIYRLSLSAGDVAPGEDILATCVVKEGGNYAYGRLFVPAGAGMYYKVSADKVGDKNTVNLFWGQNDGTNRDIYMMQLPIFEGYYWIDATEADQTFIVRTSNIEGAEGGKVTLEAEPATAEDIEMIALDPDYYWFDANDAKKNSLRYATAEVANQELQDFDEFKQKSVFVMLNPKTQGLAFGLLNQYDEKERSLAKGSIYVVASKLKPEGAPARLNVIWDDEAEDATAIQKVENKSENADAIYNLQGVRVKNAQKGIFIINGKKYVK
jgi:hypothetical protein